MSERTRGPVQVVTPEMRTKGAEIVALYPQKRAATIPLLALVQDAIGWVPPEAVDWVAEMTETPAIKVREVISFYTLLRTEPGGRHHLRVCRSITCALMGQERISAHLRAKLGCEPGGTTADGRISWEEVECLGACDMAPMVMCDQDYHGPLTAESLDRLLDGLK